MTRTVPRFRLRYRNTDYELPLGDFVVGRAPGCQLVFDDPRVSRRHALFRVEPQRLTLEDLQSRNGVLVNGVLLRGPQVLAGQDVVAIGSQELRVAIPQSDAERVANQLTSTAPDIPGVPEDPTEVGGPTPLLTLLDKNLRMSSYEEADRLLDRLFHEAESDAGLPRLRNPAALERVARAVMQLASITGRSTRVDALFTVYRRVGSVMPPALVDELHPLVRRLKHPLSPAMREYAEWLRGEAERLGPAERFALQRVEGLVRTLRGTTTE